MIAAAIIALAAFVSFAFGYWLGREDTELERLRDQYEPEPVWIDEPAMRRLEPWQMSRQKGEA